GRNGRQGGSACRWPQVFDTQAIRLRPMTLFNPVFNCLTPIVIKRSKTQAEEGLGPQPKAGDTSRRSWLCRSASAPSQQACEPVQDRCSGPCSRPRHAAAWRSRKRAPAGWVAVEATSRPRQFGYETPQLRLEGIVPNYPIGRLTVRAALRGPQCLLTRSVSEGLFPFCRKDFCVNPRSRFGLVWRGTAGLKAGTPSIPGLGTSPFASFAAFPISWPDVGLRGTRRDSGNELRIVAQPENRTTLE